MSEFVKQEWLDNEKSIGFIGEINIDVLLNINTIRQTMYQGDYSLYLKELEYLEANHPDKLNALSIAPVLPSATIYPHKNQKFCSNDIHHLYHLCKYHDSIGIPKEELEVVEWGGGYGNMAKVFSYCFPESMGSYTIFDLPKISKIQQEYLNKMNIEGVDILDATCEINISQVKKCSFFISTWALSESTTTIIDKVIKSKLVDEKILVALHQCGEHIPFFKESCYLKELLFEKGCKEEEITIIPGKNYYLMK